jgi:uncharacterized membrane protein YccC
LTIFIVLRPDYSSTLCRGVQRAAGALVGVGLGVATVQLGNVGMAALLVGLGVSLVAAYAVFTVNYLLYSVFLTDFVVVLLALLGLPADTTAIARLIGTGLGTALAVLAYVLWPTWGGMSAAEQFARVFAAQGSYASTLVRAYTRPGGTDNARLRQLTVPARRARLDAEAVADRLAGEPDHPPITARTAQALVSAGHRIAQMCLALGAAVSAHHAAGATATWRDAELQRGLDRLADGVSVAASQIAAALRAAGPDGPRPPTALPPLRDLQEAIWLNRQALAPPADSEEYGLVAATDGLVDAVNSAAHALGVDQPRWPTIS